MKIKFKFLTKDQFFCVYGRFYFLFLGKVTGILSFIFYITIVQICTRILVIKKKKEKNIEL